MRYPGLGVLLARVCVGQLVTGGPTLEVTSAKRAEQALVLLSAPGNLYGACYGKACLLFNKHGHTQNMKTAHSFSSIPQGARSIEIMLA